MTTVAYRDGILAADGRVTTKDFIESDNDRKIFRLTDGSLFGTSGDYAGGLQMYRLLFASSKLKKPNLPSISAKIRALLINNDIWYYEGGVWEKRKDDYLAIGTGGKFALAAMDAGATAKEAVRVGIKRDIYSGGKLRWLEL